MAIDRYFWEPMLEALGFVGEAQIELVHFQSGCAP